jgi:hypothetical protein
VKKSKTLTFVLELPLQVNAQQAKHLRVRFEAARCLYNALLGQAMKRLKQMRADPRWQQDRIPALIDWDDPVMKHGLDRRIKYARLIRRRASRPRVQGADCEGYQYSVQLAVEGVPYQKPKHHVGTAKIGLDLGPSTIAIVPDAGEARLLSFCSELKADKREKRRMERKLDRQRRSNNPQHYDSSGRVKKGKKHWKESQAYKATRRCLASQERKLSAHRKSLHGRLVHEVPTRSTKLSQYCHGCRSYVKKKLSERWHQCTCGIVPVQRDLYSAFLACHLDLRTLVPSIAHDQWESAETRLRVAMESVIQRANAGEALPQSMGMPRPRARLPKSLGSDHQELRDQRNRGEAVAR